MEGDNPRSATKWQTKVTNENPELLKTAQEELNENPGQRDRDIQTLRDMVLGEENLKSPTDDAFLLKFLRVCKFNIEGAFKLVKQYYLFRKKHSSVYTNYRPSSTLNMLTNGACFLLPYRDQLGRALAVVSFAGWEPSKNDLNDLTAMLHLCFEHALLEEETQVNGVVCIVDLKDFGFRHGCHITPKSAISITALIQECLPAQLKGFHYIFGSFIFDLTFKIVKPLLNQKIRSRTHFHGHDLKRLHAYIDPQFLPKEYGGFQPSYKVAVELYSQALLAREDEIVNFMENSGYSVTGVQ